MKRILLTILLLVGITITSFGQSAAALGARAKMKTMYIMQFSKLTEWPAEYKQGDFVMGVVNDEPLASALEGAASSGQTVNGQKIVVKRYKSASEVSKCHLIYISGKSGGEISSFVKQADSYSCLIVTEGTGVIDSYSAINFVPAGTRLGFELNKSNVQKHNLVVSTTLEKIASNVVN